MPFNDYISYFLGKYSSPGQGPLGTSALVCTPVSWQWTIPFLHLPAGRWRAARPPGDNALPREFRPARSRVSGLSAAARRLTSMQAAKSQRLSNRPPRLTRAGMHSGSSSSAFLSSASARLDEPTPSSAMPSLTRWRGALGFSATFRSSFSSLRRLSFDALITGPSLVRVPVRPFRDLPFSLFGRSPADGAESTTKSRVKTSAPIISSRTAPERRRGDARQHRRGPPETSRGATRLSA